MAKLKFTKEAIAQAIAARPELKAVIELEGYEKKGHIWLSEYTVSRINPNHPVVQRLKAARKPKVPVTVIQKEPNGVGTELKKLLSKIGITPAAGCSCNSRALEMNRNGIAWCEQNVGVIVGWLKEEATKRKLPFVETGAKLLIKLAIHRAKKSKS